MIQRLNSYNLLTDKVAKKVLGQFSDQIEKAKNNRELEINFPQRTRLKALKYESCLILCTCQKKMLYLLTQLIQISDQQM